MGSRRPLPALSGKPFVDRKLSSMLTATLWSKRWDNWYVYLAYDRRQMLRYVGQSGSLFTRFSQHKAAGRVGAPGQQQTEDWADIVAITCGNAIQVKAWERKLIHAFHPPDNRKCETPGCRHYLDDVEAVLANRGAVNKLLRERDIGVR